ncbi:MAG: SGNH/GDSL hydrolase family protein [Prevotellaceae bacterium]|jgi:lysophospholipase L1-like esterase|nr:SGNH/GDSL hydrolase family protein [Prevotellaceae bacterium]MDY3856222.1 SGNH/GDSL hydrolase family protein [Bacteroidaceae bacterium]
MSLRKIFLLLTLFLFMPFVQHTLGTTATDNPLATIHQYPGFCSIFHHWGFIGDSLSSGEFESLKDGKRGYHDFYEYSWGQRMCRLMGVDGDNYSQGGETARGWIDHFWSHPYNINRNIDAHRSPKQAYIIALGVNDALHKVPAGNIDTDIDLDDYHHNANTFAGQYAGIIQRIRSISPDCFVFVVTDPGRYNGAESPYNSFIRQLPAKFSRLYVIDLHKYGPDYSDKEFRSRYFVGGHLNAAGYEWTAWVMMTYIDHIIRQHPSEFAQAGFIGTRLSYEK